MTQVRQYVAYLIMPARHGGQMLFSNQAMAIQEKRVQEFITANQKTLLKTFIEMGENHRHRHRWPELEAAVDYCLEHQANLIIGELKNLTHNEAFSKQILRLIGEGRLKSDITPNEFCGEIYCCDQIRVNCSNFAVLVEHAKQQKKMHGDLIKAGLSRSTAKSGNPHASDVISKVNKPKIDNAIVFALMLQPIIDDYHQRGLSQRKMVETLNEEGFTAPEGGHWVLSQLQKVLERIKMNETALSLEKKFMEYRTRQIDDAAIAEALNKVDIPSPKGKAWDVDAVEKVSERIKQINDIIRFNEFVIELMPIIEKYHIDELTEDLFANELQMAGITLPQQQQDSV